jgi:hypothetical protein
MNEMKSLASASGGSRPARSSARHVSIQLPRVWLPWARRHRGSWLNLARSVGDPAHVRLQVARKTLVGLALF